MNRWFLILVPVFMALGFAQQAWAQAPSPASWLRSTHLVQIDGGDQYDVTLNWLHGVVDDQHPAAKSFDVYRCPVGQDRALAEYDLAGSVALDPTDVDITFVDKGVTRGAYYYYVVGRDGAKVGDPSPRCMVFAPGSYCVDILDPILTFVSTPVTVIEPGKNYVYMAFARHRSARVQGFVRYELVSGPEGLSIDAQTGTVTWNVPESLDEPVAVKIRAWSLDDERAEAFQEWGIRPLESFEIQIGSTASVQESELLGSAVAPNPAVTHVGIQLRSTDPATIRVFDLAGQAVLEQNNVDGGQLQLSVSTLAPGRYTMLVQQGNRIQTTPLMVIR